MIKLSYIDHISPYGVMVRGVGRIHSPILSDILKMGYYQYQRVLTLFLYTQRNISQICPLNSRWIIRGTNLPMIKKTI